MSLRAWYIPAWNGDWRLEPGRDARSITILTIERPVASERVMLKRLAGVFLARKWIDESRAEKMRDPSGWFKTTVTLDAPLVEVGPHVASIIKPGLNVITAVRFKDGHIEVAESSRVEADAPEPEARDGHPYRPEPTKAETKTDTKTETKTKAETKTEAKANDESKAIVSSPASAPKEADKPTKEALVLAKKDDATAAVTVRRPTPCCPSCFEDPSEVNKPATEVLLSFLSEEEHASWAAHRYIRFKGGMSGHEYLVVHRNSAIAKRNTRIAYDLDDDAVLHFHDWLCPPEEECLSAMLLLKFREDWLRNEATTFFQTAVCFKNPFGNSMDGTKDSDWTSSVGASLLSVLEALHVSPRMPSPIRVYDPITGMLVDTSVPPTSIS